MTEVFEDETFCGPVCQHPSCWSSQKRSQRGMVFPRQPTPPTRPRDPVSDDDDDDDDDGLPTQKVVNLLDDYGEDSFDRYPSKFYGRPAHERSNTVSAIDRARTGESVPRTRAPNATPASFLASTDKMSHSSRRQSGPSPNKPPRMGKVEVQEVFDPDDLASDWHDTFMAKKFYVWMPSPRKDPSLQVGGGGVKAVGSPRKVLPRDVTEDMVPADVEWQRENSKMFDDVWPVLKHRPVRSPTNAGLMDSAMTPRDKHPPRKGNYYGIYELLDLPKDVLVQVMDHVNERDLLDRRKFACALMNALPALEKGSSSLSLASSDVLKQRKVKLLDSRLRAQREAIPETKQVVILDHDALDKVSPPRRRSGDLDPQAPPPPALSALPRKLNKKKPLPSIPGGVGVGTRIPAISLGLPDVPASSTQEGPRRVRPFNYNKVDVDFTLGRIPSPQRPLEIKRSTSPVSSDHSSTIHVTMPTVRSDTAGDASPQLLKTSEYSDMDIPETPLHAVSPTLSTNVPKTPSVTPATRAGFVSADQVASSPAKHYGYNLPAMVPHGGQGQRSLGQLTSPATSENANGGLHTIHESGTEGPPAKTWRPLAPVAA